MDVPQRVTENLGKLWPAWHLGCNPKTQNSKRNTLERAASLGKLTSILKHATKEDPMGPRGAAKPEEVERFMVWSPIRTQKSLQVG